MRGRKLTIIVALAAIPVALGALYPVQNRIDARLHTVQQEREELVLRSGRVLKRMSLGYETLLANIYWTRAVQYYGGKIRDRDPNFQLLWPLLDVTVTLDPHLLVAYKAGAIFLSESPPRGAGQPQLAVDFIRRGIANNPGEWRLWADLGFIYYWDMQDYEQAAAAYAQGSTLPGARDWMRVMAAKIAAEGGSRETSRFLWAQLHDTTHDPSIRKNALEHLRALAAEEQIEQLARVVARYRQDTGHDPPAWTALQSSGYLRGFPRDPAGYPYLLENGKVRLNPGSPIDLSLLSVPGGKGAVPR